MEPKKKGRPSQDKAIRPYTIDRKIAEFIDSLPDGDRSRFVNNILVQSIEQEKLSGKFYDYFLMHPNGIVFYVGKGTGNRINEHEIEAKRGIKSRKCDVIRKIWANGEEVIKQKVAFFDNEKNAYDLEMLLIAFFGRENLTNRTDGGEGLREGNQIAKKGEHKSFVLYIPVTLVDDLHRCLELEGEINPDNSRVAEYALVIIGGYTRTKIEHNDAIIL